MASIIVISDGETNSVHVSDLDKKEAAERITKHFAKHPEFTTVESHSVITELPTIVVTADDDNDIAYTLDFTPEALRWALATAGQDPWGESEQLKAAGVL